MAIKSGGVLTSAQISLKIENMVSAFVKQINFWVRWNVLEIPRQTSISFFQCWYGSACTVIQQNFGLAICRIHSNFMGSHYSPPKSLYTAGTFSPGCTQPCRAYPLNSGIFTRSIVCWSDRRSAMAAFKHFIRTKLWLLAFLTLRLFFWHYVRKAIN